MLFQKMVFRKVIFCLYLYFQFFVTKAAVPIETKNSKVAGLPHVVPVADVMYYNEKPVILARQREAVMNAEKSKEIIEIDLQNAEENNVTDDLTLNVRVQKDQNQTSQRKEIFVGDFRKTLLKRQKRNADGHTLPPYTHVLRSPRNTFVPVRYRSIDVSNISKEFSDSRQKVEWPMLRSVSTRADSDNDDDGQKIHFRVDGKREEIRDKLRDEEIKNLKLQHWKGLNFYGKPHVKVQPYISRWTEIWTDYYYGTGIVASRSTVAGHFFYYDSEYVEYDLNFPMATYVPKAWKDGVPHPYGTRILSRQIFKNILKAMAQMGGSTFTRNPKPWFGDYDYKYTPK